MFLVMSMSVACTTKQDLGLNPVFAVAENGVSGHTHFISPARAHCVLAVKCSELVEFSYIVFSGVRHSTWR